MGCVVPRWRTNRCSSRRAPSRRSRAWRKPASAIGSCANWICNDRPNRRPHIVMAYIKGTTLRTLLHRNSRLSPARVNRILAQLCEALQAARAQGIVHRDLKPSNLRVVDADTPYEKIKVMDFGLAKLVGSERRGLPMFHKSADTGTDFAVGTPGYISPEQVRAEESGHRADLYSVAILLYELMT